MNRDFINSKLGEENTKMKKEITIIGGGLAGCEAAYQIAKRGISVKLYEMKPEKFSPAHINENLAEIVCSNSFKSNLHTNACGLLKEELRLLDSLLIKIADETCVPSGQALAVDREKFSKRVTEELEKIENVDKYNNELKEQQKNIEKEMTQIAEKINKIRTEKAKYLSQKINKELVDLEMINAKINIKVEYKINDFFENGKDQVEIFIKTNVGENESELNKIASGGEMSRIMLAIKKVLADIDNMPIMIFDEIDTGISGKAAKSVASKLKSISNKHQVLCISHLAPIAAIADYNYYISKKVENQRTSTNVKLLNEQEVLCEIARISSGEINDITLQYANELRNKIA